MNDLTRPTHVDASADANPILITAEELAAKLSISKRTIYRLLSAGAIIKPIRFRGIVRWRTAEIEEWIAAGCPDCRSWQSSLFPHK